MWGGKRQGSGRVSKGQKDWTKYKKEATERKLLKGAKLSGNIKSMFTKQAERIKLNDTEKSSKNDDHQFAAEVDNNGNPNPLKGSEIDDSSNFDAQIPFLSDLMNLPCPLPFFRNGCYAEFKQGSNYTCAPDTIYSVVEAVILANSKGGQIWHDESDLLLLPALDIVKWRILNNFSWEHELRNQFWNGLCELFPNEMLPRGTVNAALDSAVEYLSTKVPLEVVFSLQCFKCEQHLGWFHYQYETPLFIDTANLKKKVPEALSDLCLIMISKQIKQLISRGGRRVSCALCGSMGGKLDNISTANLRLPPVLILGFGIKQRGGQTVECKVEEEMYFDVEKFSLTAAVISKPMHFLAVTKLEKQFYNMDNLDADIGKKGYSTFKEALENKHQSGKENQKNEDLVHLSKRSENRRAGAVQYLVYVADNEVKGGLYIRHLAEATAINRLLVKQKVSQVRVTEAPLTDKLLASTSRSSSTGIASPAMSGDSSVVRNAGNRSNTPVFGNTEVTETGGVSSTGLRAHPATTAGPLFGASSQSTNTSRSFCTAPQFSAASASLFGGPSSTGSSSLLVSPVSMGSGDFMKNPMKRKNEDNVAPCKAFKSEVADEHSEKPHATELPTKVDDQDVSTASGEEPDYVPLSRSNIWKDGEETKSHDAPVDFGNDKTATNEGDSDIQSSMESDNDDGVQSDNVDDDDDVERDEGNDVKSDDGDDQGSKEGYFDNLNKLDLKPVEIDLRLRTFQDMGRLSSLYPGAYYDHYMNGWFCRKCQSFAPASASSNPWISDGVNLGSHPTRRMKKHFESSMHQNSLKSLQLLKKTSVYELLRASELKKNINDRNILRSMFTISLYMVKHCLPNDSFEDMVKLVGDAGSSEMKTYLAKCPKNGTHLSIHNYEEYLDVMNEYVEKPMLEVLKSEPFTIFIDETTAVGNKAMANAYVMFDDGVGVNEHYLGTINMNQKLGLTARHFYEATADLCRDKGISLTNCSFSELDGCATNQGRWKGFKMYFSFHNGHHVSESCGSHKLALLLLHLVAESDFEPLAEADKLAVNLAVYFKGSTLRTSVFENTQTVLENRVLKLVSPSPTRWLTHGKCFERLLELFMITLDSLNSLFVDKDDFQALGLMLGMIDPFFILSCLALHDVFKVMKFVTHWLQSSPAQADVTQVPIIVRNTVDKLLYLSGKEDKKNSMTDSELASLKFKFSEFSELSAKVEEFVQSSPAAGSTRRRSARDSTDKNAVFEAFQSEVFQPFAQKMAENIEQALEIDPICQAFSCLDSRNFPVKKQDLDAFGEEEISVLTEWYGRPRQGEFPANEDGEEQISTTDPKINPAEAKLEFQTYKELIFKLKAKFNSENKKLVEGLERQLVRISKSRNSGRDKKKIDGFNKQIRDTNKKELTLSDIYKEVSRPEVKMALPNISKLLLLACLCPVGNAVVERLFSLMKLIKTLLRNRLGDRRLDILLRLNKEAPEKWTEEQTDELVELWKGKRAREGKGYRWNL